MPRQRSLVLAAGAVVAAALVFGYTLARAVTVDKPPAVAAPVAPSSEKAAGTARTEPAKPGAGRQTGIAREHLVLAVDNDPFQSDRMRPSERYRMPGEAIDEEPPPPEPPPPPPNFRVVGTIATPQGGVAVVETNDATRVIGIGEEVSGFTLARVTNRSATVEGNGRSYSLQIEEPSMRRSSRAGRAGRGGAAPNAQQEIQQRLREQLERLRQNGAPPAVLEQLMQQLQGGGRGAFEFPGNLEIIRSPNGESQFILRPRGDTATVRVTPAPIRRNNN
jgi:hypothetical protein